MGGSASITKDDTIKINKIIISFYNIDFPEPKQIKSMRIDEKTTINNIITYLKEDENAQSVTLYYEKYPIEDQSFKLFQYIDLLPSRKFGYKINQTSQSFSQTQGISNNKQQIHNVLKNNSLVSKSSFNNKQSSQDKRNNNQQNNNNEIKKNKNTKEQSVNSSNNQINAQQNPNQNETNYQQKEKILNFLLEQAIVIIKKTQNDLYQIQQDNSNLKKQIEQMQLKINNEQFQQQNFSLTKFKNQCGHSLEEYDIKNILKEALQNKQIAHCNQCKPKLSGQILNKMDSLGKAYREFQAGLEINQLIINLKQTKKYVICQCSKDFCSFFCIINEATKIQPQNYYCPQCLTQSMSIRSK